MAHELWKMQLHISVSHENTLSFPHFAHSSEREFISDIAQESDQFRLPETEYLCAQPLAAGL